MLEICGLSKVFEATVALSNFDLKISAGEIIGLVGENGAGKSTLLKLLSGVYQPSDGTIRFGGDEIRFRSPRAALDAGVAMVHQELNLIPTLSAENNLFLGREIGRFGAIDRHAVRERAQSLLTLVGAKFDPGTLCEHLSIAEQQLVEIAKAVSAESKLVIFDEPTAVLSDVESQQLFALIRSLKQKGVSVIYVSHRLPEVLELCDRIVVLRDGQKVTEEDPRNLNESQLANLMVGRPLQDIFPPKASPVGEIAMFAQGYSSPPLVRDGCFEVGRGEILGIAGLIGSGRTELCESIVGLRPSIAGTVKIGGQELRLRNYREAIDHRLAYVSEDRKGKGLVTSMSVEDNLVMPHLDQVSDAPSTAKHWILELGIKVADPHYPMTSLSGGNQQKVSIARWLATDPEVLILDEPTRGVDVGAKAEIYRLIANQASLGMACVVISSELPELIGLCHRIVVMRSGIMVGELKGEEMTESNIILLASGVEGEVAA